VTIANLQRFALKEALVWREKTYTYADLLRLRSFAHDFLKNHNVRAGTITSLEADFSPFSVAMLLALIEIQAIIVPIAPVVTNKLSEFLEIAMVEVRLRWCAAEQSFQVERREVTANHPVYQELRTRGHAGLVLFSSGSTGKSKAVVHDFTVLLKKFEVERHAQRMLAFLLFDHIGGINTLFYVLSNGGCLVTIEERTPDVVLAAIERYAIELLPTSPTFLNLMLLSEAHTRHRLQSLRTITYGTEPMPASTLQRLVSTFPQINFLQTYGLSELGILRSRSKSADSLWVKIGGEGFQTRVVDGLLEIKAESAMLGYLNAPTPFTVDGWFMTGDAVLQEGEYFQILGRRSEIINVGGNKVFPAEVESIIQELAEVAVATVFGRKNLIMGQVVHARVSPKESTADNRALSSKIKVYCSQKLERFKIPVTIEIVNEDHHTARYKRDRNRFSV
jgi:long-chain acyl-CoA synthetase